MFYKGGKEPHKKECYKEALIRARIRNKIHGISCVPSGSTGEVSATFTDKHDPPYSTF
jgi:hypothetical protein